MLGIVCSSRAIGQVNSIYVWSMREAGMEARAVHDNYDTVDLGIMVRAEGAASSWPISAGAV